MSNIFTFLPLFLSFLCIIPVIYIYIIQTSNQLPINRHKFQRSNKSKQISIFLNGWSSYYSIIHNDLLYALNISNIVSEADNLFLFTNYHFIESQFQEIGFVTIKFKSNLTEFDIEESILEFCKIEENYNQNVLYIHLKGSFHNSFRNTALRKMSYYYLLLNYNDCIEKLKNGADVCGTRYSIVPNRHYSGNMWWSKCSYIKTLKPVRYMYNERKRYTIGTIGMKNDRYLAERWICSNNEVKASDLMDSDINYVYGYGNRSIYYKWITEKNNDILLSPNLKTLCHSIHYLEEQSQPKLSFFVYVNYLFDIETYHEDINSNIYNIGWCESVLNISKNEIENIKNDSICGSDDLYQISFLQDFCLLNKYMKVLSYYSTSNNHNFTHYIDINIDVSVFFKNCSINEMEYNSINNKISKHYKNIKYYCFANNNNNVDMNYEDINAILLSNYGNINMEIISFIVNYCNSNSPSNYIFYIEDINTAIDILTKYCTCINSLSIDKPICGVYNIIPFRSYENNTWFALSSYISTLNNIQIYSYNGPTLNNDIKYGINEESYKRWISINPFIDFFYFQSKLEYENDSTLASIYLIQTVFDIKSGILKIPQFHTCYSFCSHIYYKFGLYFCYACEKNQKQRKSILQFIINFLKYII